MQRAADGRIAVSGGKKCNTLTYIRGCERVWRTRKTSLTRYVRIRPLSMAVRRSRWLTLRKTDVRFELLPGGCSYRRPLR